MLTPGQQLGAYSILREVARGGAGAVCEATHRVSGERVALKVLLGGAGASVRQVQRFRQEAETLARLRHPGIIAVHEIGLEHGHWFIAMDFLPGGSLHDRLKREGRLEPREAAELVRDLAEALALVHGAGVLHRDLKPHNVLLDAEGGPVLTDFGLVKRTYAEEVERLTKTGEALGTPGYMAPEQAGGEEADARSDIYGLGATLYHLLTGDPPYADAHTQVEAIIAVLTRDPRPPSALAPGLDRELEAICLRALAREPAARYEGMADLADALDAWLARKPANPSRVRPPAWGALILAALLGIVWWSRGTDSDAAADAVPAPAASPTATPDLELAPYPAVVATPQPSAEPVAEERVWERIEVRPAPPARASGHLVRVPGSERLVLFGGSDPVRRIGFGDTWEWDGTKWAERSDPHGPAARRTHAMAADPARGVVVLFGGLGRVLYGDTWEWADGWIQRRPSEAPAARSHAALAGNPGGGVLLFGGRARRIFGDTWTWDGEGWREHDPDPAPPPRRNHGLVYDGRRGVTVLFGGRRGDGKLYADTWEWDGRRWQERRVEAGPSARRVSNAMAYDANSGLVWLLGGNRNEGILLDDLWSWDGEAWREHAPPGPRPSRRDWPQMAFDGVRGRLLLFGGETGDSGRESVSAELWEY